MRFSFSVCTVLMAVFINVDGSAQDFAGGNGTAADPWQIETPSQLDSIRWFSGDHFILMNDIDLSFDTGHPDGLFWNGGKGWDPIGVATSNGTDSFHIDGNGKIINGLQIRREFIGSVGLFSRIWMSSIINLGITNAFVKGNSEVAILIGNADLVTIEGIFVTGKVESVGPAGGLVANFGGTIRNSYANVTIENRGTPTGGLVSRNSGIITNSYSVGYVRNDGVFEEWSGLIGDNYRSTKVENSYWNIETSGQFDDEGGIGLVTLEMLTESSFENWDFSESGFWRIQEGQSYPYLAWQEELEPGNFPPEHVGISGIDLESRPNSVIISWTPPSIGNPVSYMVTRAFEDGVVVDGSNTTFQDESIPEASQYFYSVTAQYYVGNEIVNSIPSDNKEIYSGFKKGKGTPEEPYSITNIQQLQNLDNFTSYRSFVGVQFQLLNNIDATETKNWNNGKGFKPIENNFGGILNGNGYSIDNLYIYLPNEDEVGLFKDVVCCTDGISDLGFLDAEVTGRNYVGILAGNSSGYINRVFATGKVTGNENVGGILGISEYDFYNSFADVDVTGSINVGGIAGRASHSDFGFHISVGTVTGNENVGGVTGYVDSPSFFDDPLFWNIETSGVNESIVGTGLTTEEMSNKSNFEDFDFDDIWIMDNENGYPVIKWMIESPTNSEETLDITPNSYSISQNYPNPFNPSTNIKFDLPKATLVTLSIYDMLGRKVATLINKRMQAGYHQVAFNASSLASGMYIYRIEAGDFISTKTMVLIK